jgi:hypothetical protein
VTAQDATHDAEICVLERERLSQVSLEHFWNAAVRRRKPDRMGFIPKCGADMIDNRHRDFCRRGACVLDPAWEIEEESRVQRSLKKLLLL